MKFDRADGTYTSKDHYLQYRPLGVQNVKHTKYGVKPVFTLLYTR